MFKRAAVAFLPTLLLAACGPAPAPAAPSPTEPSAPHAAAEGTAPKKTDGGEVAGSGGFASAPPSPGTLPAPSDVATPPQGALCTDSGLCLRTLKAPATASTPPGQSDRVKVHYTGWTKDGKMFDSSVLRGRPAQFGVAQVIQGWTEGLQLMQAGGSYRLWIPAPLAYGERPPRAGMPSGQLTFDVELLEVVVAPRVPKDVAAPPTGATCTSSGLCYISLSPAPADAPSPAATDRVSVHYSGWTKDGKMFDSSVMRGRPLLLGLDQVIRGWTEMVQLMQVGQKVRAWIPADLAYGDRPAPTRTPAGQLTFDIELLGIE